MRYTKQTIIVSQSRISEAGKRVARQRQLVERLEIARHPADHAASLLMVMEQSLLSMRRFLSTLERDLEISLGVVAEKPLRRKAERYRAKSNSGDVAQHVMDVLRDGVSPPPKPAKQPFKLRAKSAISKNVMPAGGLPWLQCGDCGRWKDGGSPHSLKRGFHQAPVNDEQRPSGRGGLVEDRLAIKRLPGLVFLQPSSCNEFGTVLLEPDNKAPVGPAPGTHA